MSQPILQTRVSVDTSDLGEAQAKVLKLGNEAIKSGKKFKNASKGTESFGSKIGNLSETLDQKLEGSLGKAFKATDRLSAIMGAATGAFGLAVGAVGLVVGAVGLLSKAFGDAEPKVKSFMTVMREQLIEGFEEFGQQVDTVKGKLDAAFSGAGLDLSALSTIQQQQLIVLENQASLARKTADAVLVESAARTLVLEKSKEQLEDKKADLALAKEFSKDAKSNKALAKEVLTNEKLVAAAKKEVAADQELVNTRLGKANVLRAKAAGIEAEIEKIVGPVRKRQEARGKAAAKATAEREAAAKAALKESELLAANVAMAKQAAEDIESLQALEAISGPIRQQMLIDANTRIGEEAAAAALGMQQLREISQGIQDDFEANAKASKEWSDALSKQGQILDATAEAGLNAAASALIYGGSTKDALNDILESLAIESGVQAIMETARGLSDLAFGLPTAGVHFKSAAAFAAVGVAAGLGAAATGGFNGPAGEEAESEREVASPAGDTGPARAGGGPVSTVLNINLTAGSRPLTQIDARMFVDELNEIQQVAS